MSPIREQNRRLALRGLGLALRSRFFWAVAAAALAAEFLRNTDTGRLLPTVAGLLGLILLALLFLRALPPAYWFGPAWGTYWETQRMRREIEELRRELRRKR